MTSTSQPLTHGELIERLAARGLAVSAQRVVLLGVILNATEGHFTADALYQQLREQFPTLSRATVYNNLGALADAGLIEKLDTPGGARFGPEPRPHVNLICKQCGMVVDVLVGDRDLGLLVERAGRVGSFEVEAVSMSLTGRCDRCHDGR